VIQQPEQFFRLELHRDTLTDFSQPLHRPDADNAGGSGSNESKSAPAGVCHNSANCGAADTPAAAIFQHNVAGLELSASCSPKQCGRDPSIENVLTSDQHPHNAATWQWRLARASCAESPFGGNMPRAASQIITRDS
jgi:hypothetical protein